MLTADKKGHRLINAFFSNLFHLFSCFGDRGRSHVGLLGSSSLWRVGVDLFDMSGNRATNYCRKSGEGNYLLEYTSR